MQNGVSELDHLILRIGCSEPVASDVRLWIEHCS